ncbi:unnamed protein product [Amoebophrya sp. A120]|nr:unnamed protein product [Amoebophrya sp. A120]|eukprot:GSA120T00000423001.1
MANLHARGKRRGLLKVKPHRVKTKSLARKIVKKCRNGRALALNSKKNKELVTAFIRTKENSQQVINAERKAKKQPKREAYRAQKKARRKAEGEAKAAAAAPASAAANLTSAPAPTTNVSAETQQADVAMTKKKVRSKPKKGGNKSGEQEPAKMEVDE